VHDLRHSHISLLVDMGFTAKAIGDRVGHESEHITNHYTHLFPSRQTEMADRLNDAREIGAQTDNDKGDKNDVETKAG
jgi:integrase